MAKSDASIHPALIPGKERERNFIDHPLVTDSARFTTPSIKSAFNVIKNALIQRDPGVSFTADPRFGKTSAITVLKSFLPESFPDIPTFHTNAKHHQTPTEKALVSDILHDFGIDVGTRVIAHNVRRQLLNLLISGCQQLNSDRLILFVDEAQNWNEDALTWIRDISNDLELSHIRMTTIMFAQPDLLDIRSNLIGRRNDLIGRFLLRPRTFKGVGTLEDIKEIFNLLDDPMYSDFPGDSGISYSQFFRPSEYANGWRLVHEATPCWKAFQRELKKAHIKSEIGMRWLIAALRTWFLIHWEQEHGVLPEAEDAWDLAIEESDFSTSISVLRSRGSGYGEPARS